MLPVLFLVACSSFGTFRTASTEQATEPLTSGSCSKATQLLYREAPPAEDVGGAVPPYAEVVHYPGSPGELKGWMIRPRGDGPSPTLVFFHGGFAWSPAHAELLKPWADAGWIVFMPALRGENHNPGIYELLCGEVDDAEAAIRWVSGQPGVDPARIAVFGHSLGGGVAGLVSLRDELPIAASGSAGGLYFEEVLKGWGPMLPFDPSDPTERRRRLLVAHLAELKRPHLAYMGERDALGAIVEPARAKAKALGAPLHVIQVEGDHQTSLKPALDAFHSSEAVQKLVQSSREPASENSDDR